MPWPVHPTGFFGARGDQDSYRIERSLRFNSADSAYLNRTPASAGNRKTWTWSGWVKRTALSPATVGVFEAASNASNRSVLFFTSTDTLSFFENSSGSTVTNIATNQVFRDFSSWSHIIISVDTTQSVSSERVKLYHNGTQITSFASSTYPSQNFDTQVNSTVASVIGAGTAYTPSAFINGYLTEIHFIDGQALTPSSFGETDAITGRWKAKAYSGTYGTNGFYLSFKNNANVSALGTDQAFSDGKKAENNFWTVNNFSVTAGVGNDSLVDSPTNYGTDTGVGGEVRGNYCIINASFNLNGGVTSDGNLVLTSQNAGGISAPNGTIGVKSGKWYFEMQAVSNGGFGQPYAGINNGTSFGRYTGNGASSPFSTYGTYGVAFDVDAGKLWLTDSTGAWVSSGSPSTGANPLETFSGGLETFPYCAAARTSGNNASAIGRWNFGQRPFAYTAPTGFKALCTTNLPTPTIQKPSSYMDVVTYTGNGSARSIAGFGFSPDLVWIKGRSGATDHAIYDSVRGVQLDLASNLTSAETTQSQGVTAFNSDGFSIGTLAKINTNTSTYVAWAWDEAAIDGLDIVSYTGNGANRTISHNLGVAPKMMIVRNRDSSVAQNWQVYHANLTSAAFRLRLNTTDAQDSVAGMWNSTAPTSSVFSVGTETGVNENGKNFIAYLFAEVEGFSKFGSYTGNGSADGPFVWCGFRPKLIIGKRTDAVENWIIYDTSRDSFNVASAQLQPNTSIAETTANALIDFNSNGFKFRSTNSFNGNSAGGTHIFAAFAESPFKYARAR